MTGYNKLQTEIATGRLTLPVVILICLFLWGVSIHSWNELISFISCALTGYMMIEINTAFTLIRTRTMLHVSLFGFIISACMFLHPFHISNLVPPAFIIALFQLFRSYESGQASGNIFHSFFFIGLGSLAFPQLLYFAPLFYISMISFRSLSAKTFFAGLVGLIVPYWFLFGYAFYNGKIELFYSPLQSLIQFQPIHYTGFTPDQIISWGGITLISLTCSVHYFIVSYLDKTRTRLFLSFLIAVEAWIYALGLLQPQHFNVLLQLQIIMMSILTGYLFTLTRNRFSGIFFIITFVTLITLAIYNLWMQFFNS